MSIIYQRFLPAVGKSHGVRSLDVAGTIGSLLGVEVGLGVVISHGVSEGVGGDLVGVSLGLVGGGGLVGNRGGGVSGGGVDGVSNNGGSVDGVGNWVNSVVGNWVHGVVSHGVDGVMSHGVHSVVDGSVVQDMLDTTVGGSQGEDSSSNKSLKY